MIFSHPNNFFSSYVTVGREPSYCILFDVVEFLGLLVEPKGVPEIVNMVAIEFLLLEGGSQVLF